jgi:hypothetical protein
MGRLIRGLDWVVFLVFSNLPDPNHLLTAAIKRSIEVSKRQIRTLGLINSKHITSTLHNITVLNYRRG